jgi:hypothetical protein
VPARDPQRERLRNWRTGVVLLTIFVLLFVGSIVYVVLFPTVK